MNQITKVVKENVKLELSLKTKYQLQLIKEELLNIEYALNWAKSNIVNSFILSNLEIRIIERIVSHKNIPYINVEKEIEFTDINVATNGSMIVYILSLPTTKEQECETLILKSVKNNNKITKIEYDRILECKEKIFGIKSNCKKYNKKTICNEGNLVELSENNCIIKLLKSQMPNCTRTNADHISDFEEIQPGILFLNDYNDTVIIDNQQLHLSGTFIIKHHNSTLRLQDELFYVKETTYLEPLPAILQQITVKDQLEEILSLEMIKELEVQNRKRISKIDLLNNIGFSFNISFGIIIIVFVILFLAKFFKNKSQQKLIQQPGKEETMKTFSMQTGTSALERGGVNTSKIINLPKEVFST